MAAEAATTEVQNGNGAAAAETTVKPVVGFTSMKFQLVVEAPKAVDAVGFYKAAFGAEETTRVMHPKRKADQEQPLVLSADLSLAGSLFSVADSSDDTLLVKSEGAAAGFVFTLNTEDVAGAVDKAVKAGAVAEGEITEVEGSGQVAKLKDPYGYLWIISSQTEVPVPTPVADAAAA